MKKLGLLLLAFGIGAAAAAVDMNIATCKADAATVVYVNNTPDPWDMSGFSFDVAGTTVKANFPLQSSGSHMVQPKGSISPDYATCSGKTGDPYNKQLQSKIGSCNEPSPPETPVAMTCNEGGAAVATLYQDKCLQDGLGINRGDGYGGFIDSYRDQTQIQVALPAAAFAMGTKTVRFDPAKSMGGPFYMMSLVALQEYLYVDMQFMAALGASTSGAGVVDASGATLYQSPANTGVDTYAYGSFNVTYATATSRLAKDYPKYFPAPIDMAKLVSTGGAGPTLGNSPQQLNSAFFAAMNLWWLFDGLKSAQDLCFKNFLQDAKDKSAGLKLMLGGYHIGPNMIDMGSGADDYANHVLPTTDRAILDDDDVTDKMKSFPWDAAVPPAPAGPDHLTRNYITRVFDVVNQLVAANKTSKACGGALEIYDAPITLPQVKELFFGQGGTAQTLGNGGLLWHFQIDPAARAALWADLDCVFGKLKGRAPSGFGAETISYRYDFLTVLRVARQYFSGYVNKFTDRPTPLDSYSSDFAFWVKGHSQKPCGRSTQDLVFPVMTLADTVYRKGDKLTGTFTDDKGIKEYAYSLDTLWRQWIPSSANFTVPTTLGDKDKLWFRIVDSCGNAVIQQVNVKNLPPPPQLPMPTADPKGSDFFTDVNVTLKDSLASAAILYTVDGSTPAAVAGGATKLFVPGTPVVISGVTTVLKAIAIAPGYRNSEVMIETYTKVAMPVAEMPKANPPGGEFSSLSAGVSVTLSTGTAGADIFYTLDGSPPAATETGSTKKYGGIAIVITVTTTIKAVAAKAGYLPSGIMSETYTRVVPPTVATPAANPPGKSFAAPLSVSLATLTQGADILYTTDGTDPAATAGGATKTYQGPIPVSATTTIKAIAVKSGLLPSGIMSETYLFTPPVAVARAFYLDRDGDGRIETAIVEFAKEIPALPAKLAFSIRDETGQSGDRTAGKAEIAFAAGSKTRVTVAFTEPFPFGMTSVLDPNGSGRLFEQSDIPLAEGAFPVSDSVPPVVFKAKVQEPDSLHAEKRIFITLSEALQAPLSGQTALVFRHEGADIPPSQVAVSRLTQTGARDFEVAIDTASPQYPIVGDSVALNNDGHTLDKIGNTPALRTFRILEGEIPKPKGASIYVTFPNSRKDKASDGPSPQGGAIFIPVDAGGNALSGTGAEGKCQGSCFTGQNGVFVGPVFHIVTPGPVSYEFHIFNNAGEFVARGAGRFTAEDLRLLAKTNDASGIKYVARVVWTGRTSQGDKAGTGAYVLVSLLTTDKDPRSGAPPSSEKKRIIFGLLRGFKGS